MRNVNRWAVHEESRSGAYILKALNEARIDMMNHVTQKPVGGLLVLEIESGGVDEGQT